MLGVTAHQGLVCEALLWLCHRRWGVGLQSSFVLGLGDQTQLASCCRLPCAVIALQGCCQRQNRHADMPFSVAGPSGEFISVFNTFDGELTWGRKGADASAMPIPQLCAWAELAHRALTAAPAGGASLCSQSARPHRAWNGIEASWGTSWSLSFQMNGIRNCECQMIVRREWFFCCFFLKHHFVWVQILTLTSVF